MLQDYKLGLRMLLKYPGLTIAGGLALAIAIAVGAGWYDLMGKLLAPTIPLPAGDRLVSIQTRNILTNTLEFRVARDFLEWRRELRTIEELGAFHPAPRNLVVGSRVPERIQMAEITAAGFRAGRVPPLLGRGLLDSDEAMGAPGVVVLGYEVWQRSLGARPDVIGLEVRLGTNPTVVVGVMPEGFGYPFNYDAWTPLRLRSSYGALEGGWLSVIGRLAPGVTRAQADAELRVLGARTAAVLPATHGHLRSRVTGLDEPGEGGEADLSGLLLRAITNVPVLLVLLIACMSVGTLVYARTAMREGEIALRSALGASRARIVSQLFSETLVLSTLAAAVGLVAAHRILKVGIPAAYTDEGGLPFWITPGLAPITILYAGGLAVVTAGMLSILPALGATRARVQSQLANLGTGGATLRFGRLWTAAMITQVALTAIGIPAAMESASQSARADSLRATFPAREYLAARIVLDQRFEEEGTAAFEERLARAVAELEQRMAQQAGVVAVTFADRVPGVTPARGRDATIESASGAAGQVEVGVRMSAVPPGFFEAFDRPVLDGRTFDGGDRNPARRAVIVNQAFVRDFQLRGGSGSPVGARLRYADQATSSATEPWHEIVGVVRDFNLDPDDEGREGPFVFHAAPPGATTALFMHVRTRGNPAPLAARLPMIAAALDAGIQVQDAGPLNDWGQRSGQGIGLDDAQVGVTALALFLSAMGIFSLLSVTVSRKTREFGLRVALGADRRHVLAGVLSRALVLMGSGVAVGASVLLFLVALMGDNVARYAIWLVITSAIMLAAGLLASIEPVRRALRINPMEALRDA
jgi:putative ABC transport system permease protein